MKLLSNGKTNSKTAKNELTTFIMYLAPHKLNGSVNLCPFASNGCISGCLNTAGLGIFSNVQKARIEKAKFWALERQKFYIQLEKEILNIAKKYKTEKVAIRLNGTSDVDHIGLMKFYTKTDLLNDARLKNLVFYDYTKNPNQIKKYQGTNYHLTFSRSECNESTALEILKIGGNVAIVFNKILPNFWNGFRVIDGDKTDLRINDDKNVVIGLIAKGKAKKDKTGFVLNN